MNDGQFFYVYVLQSLRDGMFYIGKSEEVWQRLQRHNAGMVTSTKNRRPFKIIFYESFLHPQDANRRERYFKTTKGKVTLRQMLRCHLDQSANS